MDGSSAAAVANQLAWDAEAEPANANAVPLKLHRGGPLGRRRLPILAADLEGVAIANTKTGEVPMAPADLPELSTLKFLDEIPRFQAILRGEMPPPITVEIDPTNICNHHCVWCIEAEYISSDKNTMKREHLLRIVREVKELGAKSIVFKGGGEPLVHPAIADALQLSHELGLRNGIITNGERILAHKEAIIKYATWVRVSIDSGTPEDHEKMHGAKPGAFQKAFDGIAAVSPHVFVGTQFVLNEDNWRGAEAGARKSKEAGAKYIQFKSVIRNKTLDADAVPHMDEVVARSRRELDGVDGFRVVGTGTAKRQPPYRTCKGHQLVMILGANGNSYACCSTRGQEDYSFGSVYNTSLKEMWTSQQRKTVLDRIDNLECRAGCRARSRLRYDAYNEVFDYLQSSQPHGDFF